MAGHRVQFDPDHRFGLPGPECINFLRGASDHRLRIKHLGDLVLGEQFLLTHQFHDALAGLESTAFSVRKR